MTHDVRELKRWYVNLPRFINLHSDYSTIENLSLGTAVACPDPVHLAPVEGNELKSRKRKKPLFEWRWSGQPIQESHPSPSELRYRSDAVDTIIPCNVKSYNKVSRVPLDTSNVVKLDVKLGDTVQLSAGEQKFPFIGLVTRMMEDNSTRRKFLRARWLLRWDSLESDLVLAGEEQTLEEIFSAATQMMSEDSRHRSSRNELFGTDAFDDVDFSCILGKVSVASECVSSTTSVDHHLPPYVCRFSLTSLPGEKLKLIPRSELDKLDESLYAVGTQHKTELEASPEHLRVKELSNHVTVLKPNDDDPEVAISNCHHISSISQQHPSQLASFLGQQEQLVSCQLQQRPQGQQSVKKLPPIRIRVFVHVSNGSKLSMLVDIVVATVGDVKLRVNSGTSIKPSHQRMLLYDQELTDDSQTLYSIGLSSEHPYLSVFICSSVGDEYQAALPPLFPIDLPGNNTEYDDDRLGEAAVLVWPGNHQLSAADSSYSSLVVEEFLQKVKEDAIIPREGTLVHVRRRTVPKDGKSILKHGDYPGADTPSGDVKTEWSRVAYQTSSGSPVACDAGWKEDDEGIVVVSPEDIITVSTELDEDVMLELLFKANWDVKEALKAVGVLRAIASANVNLWSKKEVSSMIICLQMENSMIIDGEDSTLELEMMRAVAPKKCRGELMKFLYGFGQNSCHIDVYKERESLLPATIDVPKAIQSTSDSIFAHQNEDFVKELHTRLPQECYTYIGHITNCYFTSELDYAQYGDLVYRVLHGCGYPDILQQYLHLYFFPP